MIVGSILLALTLDAWWDGVQERDREAVLIERLLDEARNNQSILEGAIEDNRDFNAAALALASMDPETLRSLGDDSWRTLNSQIGGWHIFNPVEAAALSMVQSGEIRLILSKGIRAAHDAWSEAVEVAGVQAALVIARDNERTEINSAAGFYEALSRDRAA